MKKYELFVGIDVSKLKLDVQFVKSEPSKKQHHIVVANNVNGLKSIIKEIAKYKIDLEKCLVCFENTGIYSMRQQGHCPRLEHCLYKITKCIISTIKEISHQIANSL